MEFLKQASDWVLDKGDALAKKCSINPQDITKEILSLEKKKGEIQ